MESQILPKYKMITLLIQVKDHFFTLSKLQEYKTLCSRSEKSLP